MSRSDERLSLKLVPEVPSSEYSTQFLQGMLDRMGVSYFKYGSADLVYPDDLDALASLHRRVERYRDTGNTEWLIDAANFAMIEFMYPSHPEAHYRGTDSAESPGRVRRVDGKPTQHDNLNVDFD